jgi:hypothetical protein
VLVEDLTGDFVNKRGAAVGGNASRAAPVTQAELTQDTPLPVIMSTTSRPGTPIHTQSSTTNRYVPRYQNRDTVLCRLADEMGPFVVGPISADAFLNSFLPRPVPLVSPFLTGMFKSLVDQPPECESGYYNIFVSSDPSPDTHCTCSWV